MRTNRLRIALQNRFKDLLQAPLEARIAILRDMHWLQSSLRKSLYIDSYREEEQLMASLSGACETDPSKFWRTLKRHLEECSVPPPKVINHLNHSTHSPQHQADLLASAWSEVFKPHPVQGPHCFSNLHSVNSFMNRCSALIPDETVDLSQLDEDDPLICPHRFGGGKGGYLGFKTKIPWPLRHRCTHTQTNARQHNLTHDDTIQ
ncbi:uncharacterized protein LOC143026570 [Oratosquilla oratoria]|uniref:uncharacterized protein LOC143026570 n=1 Tax=Oratosquilla oratoria TaxID=337810 RepID=UPI003F772174